MRRYGFVIGVVSAIAPVAFLWGFTVDDALIVARFAHHLATGDGYRWNLGDAPVDGVTPLGYAHILSPFAAESALDAFTWARRLGAFAALVSAGLVGQVIAKTARSTLPLVSLVLFACSAPFGAWASAGLETPFAMSFVASGLFARAHARPLVAAGLFGAAAAWRPELAPMAVALAFLAGPADEGAPIGVRGRDILRGLVALLPIVGVGIVRAIAFGRATPLSFMAKAPSFALGWRYALACFLLAGALACVSPRAVRDANGRTLTLALLAHFIAIAIAGGDWMPLSRLVVPALPVMVLASANLLDDRSTRGRWGAFAMLGVAVALELWVLGKHGPRARSVEADRLALVASARPELAGAKVIVGLDVGWLSVAAAPTARIEDIAGVVDPFIATLPGGHTTRRIPDSWLIQQDVDAVTLKLRGEPTASVWYENDFDRGVEAWLATSPRLRESFEWRATTEGRLRYVILQRK